MRGDGLEVVVQPIVDIRSGTDHAYEALAQFGVAAAAPSSGGGGAATLSPLHWFALAELIERERFPEGGVVVDHQQAHAGIVKGEAEGT